MNANILYFQYNARDHISNRNIARTGFLEIYSCRQWPPRAHVVLYCESTLPSAPPPPSGPDPPWGCHGEAATPTSPHHTTRQLPEERGLYKCVCVRCELRPHSLTISGPYNYTFTNFLYFLHKWSQMVLLFNSYYLKMRWFPISLSKLAYCLVSTQFWTTFCLLLGLNSNQFDLSDLPTYTHTPTQKTVSYFAKRCQQIIELAVKWTPTETKAILEVCACTDLCTMTSTKPLSSVGLHQQCSYQLCGRGPS